MNKLICVMACSIVIVGCAGHDPHPIAQYQPGDDYMNCQMIKQNIENNNQSIYKLMPKTHKAAKNTALGVTGYFLVVPLFFMDFTDSEKVEIQAYQQRNNWLQGLARKKHCKDVPASVQFAG